MSHYRKGYQNRFVSASSSSSSTSNIAGSGERAFQSGSSSMNNVPPPPSLTAPVFVAGQALTAREKDKQKEEEYANLMFYGAKSEKAARKKRLYDDDYLEGEDSDEDDRQRDRNRSSRSTKKEPVDDEEDDLDAFMAGINEQATKDKAVSVQKEKDRLLGKDKEADKKGGRADIDEADMQESYFKYMEEKKEKANEEEDQYEYDQDGNVLWTWKKIIDPLPPFDHSSVKYPEFHKNFYVEHEDIQNMNHMEMRRLRDTLGLRVGGMLAPRPVCSFGHFKFDKGLMDVIIKSGYEKPTPIQAQAIPAALSGRDVLGIAKTGSGKTAAYLWPAITHIMDQPDLEEGDGPIALVVVPTRELAIQVYQEAKKFCKAFNINVICAYGGGSKWEQSNELKGEGAELVVCTPGRMIDLVKIGATNFLRTTFLVYDEADRMFDMGFEAQVKSISDHIRPDRQCLMFSATFKHKVERLARDALQDPVRIVQGEVGEANADIKQTIEVLPSQDAKWGWLTRNLVQFGTLGKVLIFVTKKLNAEDLANKLRTRDFKLELLHGDMLQHERNEHLQSFRRTLNIMVATDVAARGLDIPEIRTVINYDLAKDIDTHVHRVGRTGRAGHQGAAFTLVTDKDTEMAGHLVRNLESVNQVVPGSLMSLAMRSQWFRSQRQGGGGGGGQKHAKTGLGYKPRARPPPRSGGVNLDPLSEASTVNTRTVQDTVRAATQAAASGPAANSAGTKVQAMRSAFKQSFSSTFKPPTDASSNLHAPVASDPRPEWKRKIDEINARINAQHPPTTSPAPAPPPAEQPRQEGTERKRSRWQ